MAVVLVVILMTTTITALILGSRVVVEVIQGASNSTSSTITRGHS